MTRGVPSVEVQQVSRFTATVRGRHVRRVLERAGCLKQYQYMPPGGGDPCWTVPLQAVEAVMVAARSLGGVAVVEQPDLWGAA